MWRMWRTMSAFLYAVDSTELFSAVETLHRSSAHLGLACLALLLMHGSEQFFDAFLVQLERLIRIAHLIGCDCLMKDCYSKGVVVHCASIFHRVSARRRQQRSDGGRGGEDVDSLLLPQQEAERTSRGWCCQRAAVECNDAYRCARDRHRSERRRGHDRRGDDGGALHPRRRASPEASRVLASAATSKNRTRVVTDFTTPSAGGQRSKGWGSDLFYIVKTVTFTM
jgi:hypothetical protein